MSLLHPYYLVAIVYMLFFSIQEVFGKKVDKKWFWFLAVYFIIIVGLRDDVGPDYGSYKEFTSIPIPKAITVFS